MGTGHHETPLSHQTPEYVHAGACALALARRSSREGSQHLKAAMVLVDKAAVEAVAKALEAMATAAVKL